MRRFAMQNTFLCRLLFHNSDNSYNVIDLFYIPVTICAIATIIYVAKRMIPFLQYKSTRLRYRLATIIRTFIEINAIVKLFFTVKRNFQISAIMRAMAYSR